MIASGLFTIAGPLFVLFLLPILYIIHLIGKTILEWRKELEFWDIVRKLEANPKYKPTDYEANVCLKYHYLANLRQFICSQK